MFHCFVENCFRGFSSQGNGCLAAGGGHDVGGLVQGFLQLVARLCDWDAVGVCVESAEVHRGRVPTEPWTLEEEFHGDSDVPIAWVEVVGQSGSSDVFSHVVHAWQQKAWSVECEVVGCRVVGGVPCHEPTVFSVELRDSS